MFEQDRTLRTTDTARPVPKARPAFGGDLIPPIVERLAVLNRYRHVMAVGSALLKTASTLPMYRARAQVLIEIDRAAVDVFRQTYYEDPEPFLETQYGVLRSRDLARRVVQRIDLAQMPEFNGEGVELPAPSRAWALVERVIRSDPPIPSAAARRRPTRGGCADERGGAGRSAMPSSRNARSRRCPTVVWWKSGSTRPTRSWPHAPPTSWPTRMWS